jgi:thymidylate synthase
MFVITVRNVHDALPEAIYQLYQKGVRRESRNGPVLQFPMPVSTVYERPIERVMFWPERDANPFLHLYESLWMLAGRNDVAPLKRYTKQFEQYSDDGATFHGAYGHRWRSHFGMDQLPIIVDILQDSTERRAVLTMWDPKADLGRDGKDLPCNDMATFQIDHEGKLNMVVFCRSNDIVWGAYGANAVHFSFLLEYMANWMQVEMGTYTQISVNWHGYLNTLEKVQGLPISGRSANPYQTDSVVALKMPDFVDPVIFKILDAIDSDFHKPVLGDLGDWGEMVYKTLSAHFIFKRDGADAAITYITRYERLQHVDWVTAARQWLYRRKKAS